jgi:AcrR family transcriptional regulator
MRSETPESRAAASTFIETARRRQLVDAAVVTVTEVGYHRASLAEIGRRAGIAKSAVVYYFASKEGLLLELVGTVFGALGERVLAAVDGVTEPIARLTAYSEAYLAHIDAERRNIAAAVEIVVSHRTADGTPLYLVNDESDTALLRSILHSGIASGAFQPLPLDIATGFAESDLSELRAHAVPLLLRALGAGHG